MKPSLFLRIFTSLCFALLPQCERTVRTYCSWFAWFCISNCKMMSYFHYEIVNEFYLITFREMGPWLCFIPDHNRNVCCMHADVMFRCCEHDGSVTVSLILPFRTSWICAMLLMFQRYMLLPYSGLRWVQWVTGLTYLQGKGRTGASPSMNIEHWLWPWRWRQSVLLKHQQHCLHPHNSKTQEKNNMACAEPNWSFF